MKFEWDESKNQTNLRKHGISFDTTLFVFDDPFHISIIDKRFNDEDRWQTVGLIKEIPIFVAHTVSELDDEETIRVISARSATPGEARRYYVFREK